MLVKNLTLLRHDDLPTVAGMFPQHDFMVGSSREFIHLNSLAIVIMETDREGNIIPKHDEDCSGCEPQYRIFIYRKSDPCPNPGWVCVKYFHYNAWSHTPIDAKICKFMGLVMVQVCSGRRDIKNKSDFVAIVGDEAHKLPVMNRPFLITKEKAVYTQGVGPGCLISPEVFLRMRTTLLCCHRRGNLMPFDLRVLLAQILTVAKRWTHIRKI